MNLLTKARSKYLFCKLQSHNLQPTLTTSLSHPLPIIIYNHCLLPIIISIHYNHWGSSCFAYKVPNIFITKAIYSILHNRYIHSFNRIYNHRTAYCNLLHNRKKGPGHMRQPVILNSYQKQMKRCCPIIPMTMKQPLRVLRTQPVICKHELEWLSKRCLYNNKWRDVVPSFFGGSSVTKSKRRDAGSKLFVYRCISNSSVSTGFAHTTTLNKCNI